MTRSRDLVLRAACGLEALEGRRLLSASVWQIKGDAGGKPRADVIRVELSPTDATRVQAAVNGKLVGTRTLSSLRTIRVLSGGGNDDVTIDLGDALTGVRTEVVAGAGNDSVHVTGAVSAISGGAGDDTLAGDTGNDVIDGGAGNDLLQGNGGDDTLTGDDGNDVLAGAAGRDRVDGGGGADRMYGGDGSDVLLGRAGDDTLYGGAASDVLSPGDGRDKLYKGRRRGIDRVVGASQADVQMTDPSGQPAFRQFSGEADFDQWLIDAAVRRWQDLFGQPATDWTYWERLPGVFKSGASPSGQLSLATDAAPGAAGSTDHSTTNNQVAGVDEADRVQTDGTYLYIAEGSELVIVSANPADHMAVVSRTDVGGYISGLYLFDGKVTVLASHYDYNVDNTLMIARPRFLGDDIWWGASKTLIETYDVSDAAAPALAEKSTLDGYLTDSRQIDGRVYAIVTNDLWMPGPKVVGTGDAARYETEDEYRQRLSGIVATRQLPQFTSTAGSVTRAGSLVSVPDTYVSGNDADSETLTSVVLIDPTAGDVGPDATATVLGPSGTVYATADSLYVTGWDWDDDTGVEQTNLAKFSLTPTAVSLQAVGEVEGSIIDQFSMGENSHGDLNIATTSGWGNDASNNVYTLRQHATHLDTVGAILDLAPGERIFSSRFVGDQGYLVTYHQTDPLFTLDLSDPTNPVVAGELQITGFSSYLQPIGTHYLLGLGHAGDSSGSVGGLQLSLFDVADPANPVLVGRYTFQGEDSGSSAEYDAHAIQYFAEQGVLALPVWKYDSTTDDFVEGTAVVKVDTSSGFTQLGFVQQDGADRSVRIDQTLYTVGWDTVDASDLNDPSHLFGTVTISDDSGDSGGDGGGDGGIVPMPL